MLEAAQHNNSMSDSYAIFANSTMYAHSPHRIQPMPPPQAKAADPVRSMKLSDSTAHLRLYLT